MDVAFRWSPGFGSIGVAIKYHWRQNATHSNRTSNDRTRTCEANILCMGKGMGIPFDIQLSCRTHERLSHSSKCSFVTAHGVKVGIDILGRRVCVSVWVRVIASDATECISHRYVLVGFAMVIMFQPLSPYVDTLCQVSHISFSSDNPDTHNTHESLLCSITFIQYRTCLFSSRTDTEQNDTTKQKSRDTQEQQQQQQWQKFIWKSKEYEDDGKWVWQHTIYFVSEGTNNNENEQTK